MVTEFRLNYTAEQVNSKLGEIENLAKRSELPTKLSELTNDSGFATESYVNTAVNNIDIYDTIEINSNTAGKNLQNDGEEIYWIPEGYARAKGDPLSVSPVADTKVDVITKFSNVISTAEDWTRPLKKLYLNHITGSNVFNLLNGEAKDEDNGQLYYAGAVIEKSGVTGTINADYTITISGMSTSGCLILNTKWWTSTRNSYTILPAGTYTTHQRLIVNLKSLASNTYLQVGQGQFTLTEPHYVVQVLISCGANVQYNETIPFGIYLGGSIPVDTAYHGNLYCVEFSNFPPANATFNWSSGELVDKEGNVVESVSPTQIISFDGANTFLSGFGVNTVSYATGSFESGHESNAYKFNPEEYPLPILYLDGVTDGMNKDNKVTLNYRFKGRSGTCTCKWQGSSSLAYEKKNYTVVFDTPFEAVSGWGSHSKYCMKANYIDFSHVRNICSARLWGEARKTIGGDVFQNLINAGAIDGFPIAVVINDEYKGLYSFNIPKDAWMFGYSGDVATEAIVSAEMSTDATMFKAPAVMDGSDFEFEHIADSADEAALKASFGELYNKVVNYSATDMYNSELSQILDMDRLLDYYVFVVMFDAVDCYKKNYLMTTKDGVKWHIGAYDLDTTFGNQWQGVSYYKPTWRNFAWYASESALFNVIYTHHKNELKARYNLRKNDKWSEENLFITLYNYAVQIPKIYFDEEVKLWKSLPGTNTNDISEIMNFHRLKIKHLDNEIKNWG